MAEQLTDVLVAGYPDVDTAAKEFDALIAGVKAKAVKIQGAILISHDKDGNVVGLEMLHASKRIKEPDSLQFALASATPAPALVREKSGKKYGK